jgi:hypothetical protein
MAGISIERAYAPNCSAVWTAECQGIAESRLGKNADTLASILKRRLKDGWQNGQT